MNFKVCLECKHNLDISLFSMNSKKHGTVKTKCKKCCSRIQIDRRVRLKAEKNPDKYYDCSNEDCGHVWSKSWGVICIRCKAPKEN